MAQKQHYRIFIDDSPQPYQLLLDPEQSLYEQLVNEQREVPPVEELQFAMPGDRSARQPLTRYQPVQVIPTTSEREIYLYREVVTGPVSNPVLPKGRAISVPLLLGIAAVLLLGSTLLVPGIRNILFPPTTTPTAVGAAPTASASAAPAETSATPPPSAAPVETSATPTPSATPAEPAPTLSPSGPVVPTPMPLADPGRVVYRIAVVRPGGVIFGDRGNGMELAAEMAAEDLASGRLQELTAALAGAGIELQVYIMDDRSDPDRAAGIADQIVADPSTRCVVGHYNSGSSIKAGTIYSDNGMLTFTPASTNPLVTKEGRNTVWRLVSTDEFQGLMASQLAAKQLSEVAPGKKILIVRVAAETYAEGVEAEVRAADDADLFLSQTITFTRSITAENDMGDPAAAIKSLGEQPGMIFFIGTDGELSDLLQELGNDYKTMPFFGVSLLDDVTDIDALRNKGYTISYTGLAVPADQGSGKMARWFVDRYGPLSNGAQPSAYAAETYDGIYMCARAIEFAVEERASRDVSASDISGLMSLLVASDDFGQAETENQDGTVAGPYLFDTDQEDRKRELKFSLLFHHTAQGVTIYQCNIGNTPPCSPQ